MENKNYTELDKFIQSRLTQEEAQSQEWNTPSDQIFLAAQAEVNHNKRDRKVLFYWFAGLLLVGLIVGLIFSNNRRIQKLEKLNDAHIASEISALPIEDIEIKKEEDVFIKEEKKLDSTLESSEGIVLQSEDKIEDDVKTDNLIKQDYTIVEKTLVPLNSAKEESMDVKEEVNAMSREIIENIEWLERLALSLNNGDSVVRLSMQPELLNERKQKTQWSFTMFGGINFSSMAMRNVVPASYTLTEYDKYYMGRHLGISTDYNFSDQFGLEGSIKATQVQNQSLYEDQMVFDEDNIVHDPVGGDFYESDMKWDSPTMPYNAEFRMSMDGHQLAQNDIMKNEVKNDQEFTLISIGIKPYWQHSFSEKISLRTSVGPELFLLASHRNHIQMKMYHDGNEIFDKSLTDNNTSEMNRINLALSSEVSLIYNFNQKIFSKINGGWMHSITSLRNSGVDNTHTSIKDFQFGASLGISF